MKIISWNINKAAYTKIKDNKNETTYTRKNFWGYVVRKLDFDVGLFQEVYMIPNELRNYFHVVRGEMNAILIKKNTCVFKKEDVLNIDPKTNSEKPFIKDFFVSCEVEFSGKLLSLISVYNYMGPGVEDFREFLDIVYKYIQISKDKIVIVGGDFNMDYNYKGLKAWTKCKEDMIKEFSKLGYEDPLDRESDEKRFTWSTRGKSSYKYKLDYLFLPIRQIKINRVETVDKDEIFKQQISDHLPIIAEIEL